MIDLSTLSEIEHLSSFSFYFSQKSNTRSFDIGHIFRYLPLLPFKTVIYFRPLTLTLERSRFLYPALLYFLYNDPTILFILFSDRRQSSVSLFWRTFRPPAEPNRRTMLLLELLLLFFIPLVLSEKVKRQEQNITHEIPKFKRGRKFSFDIYFNFLILFFFDIFS